MAEPPGKSIKERRVIDFPGTDHGEMGIMKRRPASGWRSFQRGARGLVPLVQAGARVALRSRFRNGGSHTLSTNGGKGAPAPITGESDWRNVYRKKRFPRRRKKRWVRFVRKVKHVVSKGLAPQFNVLVKTVTVSAIAGSQGSTDIFTVLGSNGNSHTNDMSYLFDRAFATIIPNTSIGGQTKQSLRIQVTGWMAECVVVNYGLTLVYLDCYYWRTKKNYKSEGLGVKDLWTNSLGNVDANIVPTGTETKLTIDDYGVTPFQGPTFVKHCEIWKKTRVKIPSQGTAQFVLRSGRDHYRSWSFDQDFALLQGATEGILFVQYGAPTELVPITSGSGLRYTLNTNYTWRVQQDNRMKGMHDLP